MSAYRPDIDGLRAIAVSAVVLYHGKFTGFSGGFVGVDVFFVISGFLISSIILADIDQDRFSIMAFYERRIRRIFPALFVILLFSFIVSSVIFLPGQFVDFARSATAISFFISNIAFDQGAGYFGGAAEHNPLLHTWSLSVEEQFYVVFPIALVLAIRHLGRGAIVFMLMVAAISFAASNRAVADDPVSAFYLSWSRGWELLVGYFLASGSIPRVSNAKLRNMGALLGLGLICWSVVNFGPPRPFPGANALFPIFGAALIIHAGTCGATAVGKLLSARPVVFVGLISYSLYLWHWPLLVFTRHYFIGVELDSIATAAVLGLAVALSVLTWKYIEQPFRKPRGHFRIQSFRAAGTAILAMAGAGLIVVQGHGFANRFANDVVEMARGTKPYRLVERQCHDLPLARIRHGIICSIGVADGADPAFILWGDSHAGSILAATIHAASSRGYSGLYAGMPACPPFLGSTRPGRDTAVDCGEFNERVFETIRSNRSVKTVILAARWARYADGHPYKQEPGSAMFIGDSISKTVSFEENKAAFVRGLRRTISQLVAAGKEVTIFGPVPEVGWHVPRTLAMLKYLGVERQFAPTREEFNARQHTVIRAMNAMADEFPVRLVFPHDTLCPGDRCSIQRDARPLYFDDDHLSTLGATLVLRTFDLIVDRDTAFDRM